jgi:hypothetical protein
MVFLALWIISTGVTLVISSSNGYNTVNWVIIGLFLGPLGLLLSILMPPARNMHGVWRQYSDYR